MNKEEMLIEASYRGFTKVVKKLLEQGVDIHANNNEVLRLASLYGHTRVVKLLLEHGANVHVDNEILRLAGYYALWNGHDDIVDLFNEYINKKENRK